MSAHSPAFDSTASPPDAATPRPGRRITQRDIARHVGVSHVAVSLALRRNSRISPSLTRRIQDAAEELGYHPDPGLLVLNNYRLTAKARPIRATLAWISPGTPSAPEEEPGESALHWQGARETAERNGFHLDRLSADARAGSVQRVLETRAVQGLLLAPAHGGAVLPPPALDWSRLPVVRLGQATPGPRTHRVSGAEAANAVLAADAIQERGYRRPGFVSTLRAARHTLALAGFLQAGALRPGDVGLLPPLLLPEADAASDLRTLETWLAQHRPDAILTDFQALPHLLARLGLSVPRDLALATLNIHGGPAGAGIDQNPREVGAAACETLITLIKQGVRGLPALPRDILIGGSWVDGASLPRRAI